MSKLSTFLKTPQDAVGRDLTINPGGGTYKEGMVVTLTASPNPGYQVKSWSGTNNDASKSTSNTVTMDSDKTVTVEFEPIPYNLDAYVIGDHGTIHPSSGIYDFGTILTLTATPDEGYQVKEWHGTDDDPSINNSNTVTIDSDKIISVIFEKIPDTITFNKCNIKAGKIRSIYQPTDSIIISGYSFDAADSDFSSANTIYVEILNANEETPIFSDEIDVNAGKYKNGKFNYKGSNGRITSLEFDISKNTFSITAKNIDLTGLRSPIAVEIRIGDYFGTGVGYDGEVLGSGGNLDIINGKKPIPIQFMIGNTNSLCVDKCTFKLGTKKPSTDSLTIQGAIAVEDTSVDIAGEDVVVSWGNYSITLPANDIYRIGYKKSFKYKKPKGSDSSVAAAVFDLEKCTFKIVIKNANISSQNNPIDFSIQFADFSKTVTLQLTEK